MKRWMLTAVTVVAAAALLISCQAHRPAPINPELKASLIRVVGDPKNPLVLFRSDALVETGQLEASPGKEFFTAFVVLGDEELDRRKQAEGSFAKAKNPSETTLVFKGRTPVAITTGVSFDLDNFFAGGLIALFQVFRRLLEEAADGQEALYVARYEKPDLIVLDLMMPEMGGYEFLRAHSKEQDTPVIILTAKLEENDKVLGLELGADDYVIKPFSMRELTARV